MDRREAGCSQHFGLVLNQYLVTYFFLYVDSIRENGDGVKTNKKREKYENVFFFYAQDSVCSFILTCGVNSARNTGASLRRRKGPCMRRS